MPTALLTGFGPFPGVPDNPTAHLAARLDGAVAGDRAIRAERLSVALDGLAARLEAAVLAHRPTILLLTGVAERTAEIRLETHAWNRADFPCPDQNGAWPRGVALRPGGPDHYRAPLPEQPLARAMDGLGLPWRWSDDPGRYVCNALYYYALDRLRLPCLFLHVPLHADAGGPVALDSLERCVVTVLMTLGSAAPTARTPTASGIAAKGAG